MNLETTGMADKIRALYTLAFVNSAMWALTLIALIFVIQKAPSAKGFFVILASGCGVSITLLSAIGRARKTLVEGHE